MAYKILNREAKNGIINVTADNLKNFVGQPIFINNRIHVITSSIEATIARRQVLLCCTIL